MGDKQWVIRRLTIDTALDPDVAVLIASCTVASVEHTGVGLKYANSK